MTAETSVVRAAPRPGSSRGRWLVALGITGLATIATVVAVVVLGGRPTPEALRYVPADAVIVAELRLDLPGDQLQKVGNLLAHFPGFADQSTLDQKLDKAGDRLVGLLSNGDVSYTGDLKPWVSGPVYAAFRGVGTTLRLMSRPNGLVIATTNGAVGCDELFEDRTTTTEPYRGFEIRVLGTFLAAGATACVVDGRYVLAGDLESVKAGLGAHADGDGIAASDRYLAARAALAGDQLATLFIRGEALERVAELRGALPTAPALPLGASLPDWSIVGVRAEDDALVVDAVAATPSTPSAAPSLASLPATHPSELTRHVPLDALVYAELQGAGVSGLNSLTLIRAEPLLATALTEADRVLTAFGGAEQLVGWVDDAALVVLNDGGMDMAGDLVGGVLLLAPDATTAAARVGSYRALLALAASAGQVELRSSTSAGVEVTTVEVSDGVGLPLAGPLEISFAVRDRLVVIGTSESFVELVLGQTADRSLAASPSYLKATERRLDAARGTLYVSAVWIVHYARLHQPSGPFDPDVLPYVSPINAIYMSATDGPGLPRARIVMTVSDPQE